MITGNLEIAKRLGLIYLLQLMQRMCVKIKENWKIIVISKDNQRFPKYR
jgi:hypothetical protein